jgi:3-dehydroquinate synthase
MHVIKEKQTRPYKIYITDGFEALGKCLQEVCKPSSLFVITDSEVAPFYLKEIVDQLKVIAPTYTFSFEAGEESKHLQTIQNIYDAMISLEIDRSATVVAVGGGVVGDMAGFVAATYLRGISFIQVPTTVVAQNDSSIGGKVGVDYHQHKNMIGAFYQPLLVYSNVNALTTLPIRHYESGVAEVLKHAIIKDKDFFSFLKKNAYKFHQKDINFLKEMTKVSSQIKCTVVEEDVRENGSRKLLNFGHTIGHAIETLSDFAILHGECVAYGMCISTYISFKREFISQIDLEEIVDLCKLYGLLKPIPTFDIQKIMTQMQYDKKKAYGKISFVLLEALGLACTVTDVTEKEIEEAILFTQKTCQ